MNTNESDKIRERYNRREGLNNLKKSLNEILYIYNLTCERERCYTKLLYKHFDQDLSNISFLEVGAGFGNNLHFFLKSGLSPTQITANELIEKRLNVINQIFPNITIIPGNALEINSNIKKYDLILVSTVFTSILDDEYKKILAEKILSLLNEKGMIIFYDFIFNNPMNRDVKGIKIKEVKKLFNQAGKIKIKKVTIAPPVGRVLGRYYNIINSLCPFLRSHIIAIIYK